MTTNESASQPRLSTDLQMLHSRVKDKSLTLAELKQSLKGRGPAMLLILLALPFCFIAIPGLSTDIIPDFVPEIGYADDSLIVRTVLSRHQDVFRAYCRFRKICWSKISFAP